MNFYFTLQEHLTGFNITSLRKITQRCQKSLQMISQNSVLLKRLDLLSGKQVSSVSIKPLLQS